MEDVNGEYRGQDVSVKGGVIRMDACGLLDPLGAHLLLSTVLLSNPERLIGHVVSQPPGVVLQVERMELVSPVGLVGLLVELGVIQLLPED